jgi:prepilin-type N-terminal cleavage/methylation domain-containing protein
MMMCDSKARGFTLLELLIAISMLVIVMTTLYGSYRSILTRNPWIDNNIQSQEMARICLNQMQADLCAAYIVPSSEYRPPQSSETPNPYCLIVEPISTGRKTFPRLGFSSLYHLKLVDRRLQDIAHIVYYVQQLSNGAFVLRRSETFYPYPMFKENPADPIVCKAVRSLNYTFYDSKGKEYQSWDSDSSDFGRQTPAAVHITMELEARQGAVLKMGTGLVFPAVRTGNTRIK